MPSERAGGVLLALLLCALLVAPGAGAPAGSPVPRETPATAVTGAHEEVSTDLLALADDRFLLPNQSRGEVVAALARSGHYARGGQRPPRTGHAARRPGRGLRQDRPGDRRGRAPAVPASGLGRGCGRRPRCGLGRARPGHRPRERPVGPRGASRRPSVASARARSRARGTRCSARPNSGTRAGSPARVSGSGVISDGVDHWSSARATGDLPADLTVLRNEVGGDEGTAMLEIVHDIAPNASLVFHDCGWNVLEFNQAIDALADAGCRVIVDDIGWTDEPFFEDGVVAARAADAVSRRGVVYISAAGNDAGLHYQGLFQADGAGVDGRSWHDFSSGATSASQPALRRPAARGLGHGGPRVVRAVRGRLLQLRPRAQRHGGPLGPAGGQLAGPGRERRPPRGGDLGQRGTTATFRPRSMS